MITDIERGAIQILVDRALSAKVKELNGMGKLTEVAARIRDTKKRMNEQADDLAARIDIIDHRAPEIFAHGYKIVSEHHADLDEMENELRQISNLEK